MHTLLERMSRFSELEITPPSPKAEGHITRLVGLTLEAEGIKVALGDYCLIYINTKTVVEAEVVGFAGDRVFLMPLQSVEGLTPGAKVVPKLGMALVPVGEGLLGRIIDGIGRPLDDKGALDVDDMVPLQGAVINPLSRHPIDTTMDVGVRAINSMLTVGRGQRLGLFAGSGVGKSVLLGMMTRFTEADIVVVGLIGERGREVREFIDHSLGKEGLARSVVIASPADDSPLMRLRAAELTNRVAEYYRDQGKNVLLLMDSLTRYAQAQREISLAVGELPATKGYPPSAFAKLPKLVERAGNGKTGGGSITAFYTVLAEGDDQQDPIADAARAILDGHIVLSRKLAEKGHYPAIDIEQSISRAMPQIVDREHLEKALETKRLWATYHENADLISMGAYQAGSSAEIDKAIQLYPYVKNYLRQGINEPSPFKVSIQQMRQLEAQAQPSRNEE